MHKNAEKVGQCEKKKTGIAGNNLATKSRTIQFKEGRVQLKAAVASLGCFLYWVHD